MDQATSNPQSEEIYHTTDDAAAAFEQVLDRRGYVEPGHEEERETPRAESPIPDEADDVGDYEAAEEEDEQEEEIVEVPETELYRVTVDGEELDVSLQELLNGYSRQRNYTTKTQALAAERRQVEELLNAYSQRIAQVDQLAQSLQENPQVFEPEINWQELYESDPVGWLRERELYRDRQQLRTQRDQQLAALRYEQQQLNAQRFQAHLAQEHQNLVRLIPEWQDETRAKSEKTALRDFAINTYGLTEQDVNGASDSRIVKMLRDAWLYNQGQQKATQATRPKPEQPSRTKGRSVRPESSKSRLSDANKRLAQSGSLEDAERVFEQMFG